jgi:membrane-bound serine protease (ClpP class)
LDWIGHSTRNVASLVALLVGAVVALHAAVAIPVVPAAPATGLVAEVALDGPIGPAAAEYFDQALGRAEADGAVAIVLRLDTPGGLVDAMRQIVARILAAKIPVLGYVAPGGARAASAGTYILYACQLAAMAPATHLGAATPVSLGGATPMPSPLPSPKAGSPNQSQGASDKPDDATRTGRPGPAEDASGDAEENKVLNDSIAYIRSLAQLRGRNAEWAEAAVRGAATLTASEAAEKHVIDFVAADVPGLLAQADGRQVRVGERSVTVQVKDLPLREYAPNWRTRFLAIIGNPTLAYLLLLAGIYGLVLEGLHPGALLPGIAGGICLLIGLYALQLLPVNYAGLALIALGVALLIGEAMTPNVGALGAGGLIAFVAGSILLFDADVPGYAVNLGVIAGIATAAALLLATILYLVLRARRAPRFSGDAHLLHARGELLAPASADGESWARVQGERWRVRSSVSLPQGARVRVVRREGLLLWVAPE